MKALTPPIDAAPVAPGMDFEALMARAKENLKASSTVPLQEAAPGVYVSPYHDTMDASRMLLTDLFKGLPNPFNVARYRLTQETFERVPQEFCQENVVLPVGQVGDFLLVALANPFELTISTKIQEMTGKKVVCLLGRDKDIREKFTKGAERPAGFDDVVEQIGVEFATEGDGELK